MSTLDDYRQAIYGAVVAAKAAFTEFDVVVEYDNRIVVDHATQVEPYLCVAIRWQSGRQADLSNKPFHRLVGAIILTANSKEGSGTAKGNRLLEHFYTAMQKRKIGDVRVEMADLVPPPAKPVAGIYQQSVVLPIWVDKFY